MQKKSHYHFKIEKYGIKIQFLQNQINRWLQAVHPQNQPSQVRVPCLIFPGLSLNFIILRRWESRQQHCKIKHWEERELVLKECVCLEAFYMNWPRRHRYVTCHISAVASEWPRNCVPFTQLQVKYGKGEYILAKKV